MKHILKLTKLIIIMITIILMTGCTTESENNTGGTTYKVAGDQYHNYIKETVKTVIDKNYEYSIINIVPEYPYIQIYINYNNKIDETSFDNKNNEIADKITKNIQRGVTVINSQGYYSKKENKFNCLRISANRKRRVASFISYE